METITMIAAYGLSFLCLVLAGTLFVRLKPPYSFFLAFSIQMAVVALSPFLAVLGLVGAGLGWLSQAPIAVAAGLLGAGIWVIYITLVSMPQPGFDLAFGKDWPARIPPAQASRMLKRRWGLGWPRTGKPRWERDIPFWTIPDGESPESGAGRKPLCDALEPPGGAGRKLLCDVWEPPEGIDRSGLAIVYLHGSGWWFLDKDFGTRPLFRHLAAQGHVIMDVAYRLCPEVDIYGMIGDVKRAVAWMKANAARYQVDPERVVLGGASAGGHLALLAAYAPHHALLTPAEVQDCDLAIRAVFSFYGPTDLRAVYHHLAQERLIGLPKIAIGPESGSVNRAAHAGRMDTFMGGHLHEVPEIYELASPVAHVHPGCPPTLLIQGEPDVIEPVHAARELHRSLVACGIPTVNIIYPLTNHMFDVLLPQTSPPASAELFSLERFLALMV